MNTVTFKGTPLHLMGNRPAFGQKAPDFTLAANDLSPAASRTMRQGAGAARALLDTPCDMEVRRFNKEAAAPSDKVRIVAVSCDLARLRPLAAWRAFRPCSNSSDQGRKKPGGTIPAY